MRKNKFLFLFILMVTSFTVNASGKIIQYEEALEFTAMPIKMSKDLTGVITGRVCQRCEPVVVKITPATELVVGDKNVALKFAPDYSGKAGVVFFNIKTRLVTKIRSYK